MTEQLAPYATVWYPPTDGSSSVASTAWPRDDPEITRGNRARNERRRRGLRTIVGRWVARHGRPRPDARDEAVAVLPMLTSFETFDALAGADRIPEEVVPVVLRLSHAALWQEAG